MSQLTRQQEETLRDLEMVSFNEFCSRIKKDSTSYAKQLSDVLIGELNRVIHLSGDGIPQSGTDHLRNAIQQTDIFGQLKIVEDHANGTRLTHIVGGAPRQMLNYRYLQSLAESMRLPVLSPGDDNALRALLDSVPLRLIWDNNFNAFVTGETLLDNIPCVCVYHTITSGLKSLAAVVATAIIELGDPFPIIIRCKEIRHENSFKADCRKALQSILGEGDLLVPLSEQHVFGSQDQMQMYIYTSIIAGAFDFVWLHEYGHLLLGHLLEEASHRVEFEADEFAAATMFSAVEKFPKFETLRATQPEVVEELVQLERKFYLWGAALSLSVMCLFDLFQESESPTHPPGKARVKNIAKRYPEIDILNFVRNVHHALNPTLQDYWGVSTKIDQL